MPWNTCQKIGQGTQCNTQAERNPTWVLLGDVLYRALRLLRKGSNVTGCNSTCMAVKASYNHKAIDCTWEPETGCCTQRRDEEETRFGEAKKTKMRNTGVRISL